MITIAIISPKISLETIERVISNYRFDCVFHKYVYYHPEEIAEIYEECKDRCDVIFCSGELGYHYLMQIRNLNKPCTFVSYEGKHFLAMALDFVVKHPDIPLSRVYCDFLTPVNNYLGIKKCLKAEYMPYCQDSAELSCSYDYFLGRAKELWESGKIDMVLTRSSSRLDFFRKWQIPFIHILPSDEMIAESIENAIQMSRLNIQANQYKASILVKTVCPENTTEREREYFHVLAYKCLLDFRREHELDFSVQTSVPSDRFRLVFNVDSIEQLSQAVERLIQYLSRMEELEFRIGASASESLEQSCYQSETALHEAIRYGKNDGFIVDAQSGELVGPLLLVGGLKYSYNNQKAAEFSKKNGIPRGNLQKIAGLFSMNPRQLLTTAALAELLNITPRSCSRILQQLLESGLIREVEPYRPVGKGRPTRQYQFVIEQCEKNLF